MNNGGSVVLVSSDAAMEGLANNEAIAAAKAGIIGLTLSAAATYASMNLRVNAVAPGLTKTPMTAALTGNEPSRKFSESMHAWAGLASPKMWHAPSSSFLTRPTAGLRARCWRSMADCRACDLR